MTVFVDTFALIAWLNASDSAHDSVATYLDGFTGKLLATEWVLMELADAMSSANAPFGGGGFSSRHTRRSAIRDRWL